MNRDNLFKFYEKLYFHEIEMREKLNARIQIYLAIIAALFSLIAFILKNVTKLEFAGTGFSFIIILAVDIVFLFIAIYYFGVTPFV